MSQTYADEVMRQVEPGLIRPCQQVSKPSGSESDETPEEETPEVFELHPLSTQRVMARIIRDEPAPFYFVADDDSEVEDIEEETRR